MAAKFIPEIKGVTFPPKEGEVFGLALNGIPLAEIAITLGKNKSTVKNQIWPGHEGGALNRIERAYPNIPGIADAGKWQMSLFSAGVLNVELNDGTIVEGAKPIINKDKLDEVIPGIPGTLVNPLINGLTHQEIAEQTGKSASTIKNQVYGIGAIGHLGIFGSIEARTGKRPANITEVALALIDLGVITF